MQTSDLDLSIIIVHTFETGVLRQTLRSIRCAAPQLQFEVVIVDNNPVAGLHKLIKNEFPEIRYFPMAKNLGFGGGMNQGISRARGRYVLIFNPDIVVLPGSLEELMQFMDANPEVGIAGPQLLNPDGSLQHTCYRIPTFMIPAFRRTPLGKFPRAKNQVEEYMMIHDDHSETMDVDALIGAALFARREALARIGLFDERFFLYYEDNDLCRRCWENGYRVVYRPESKMLHYHRRMSADGGLVHQLTSKFTWIHIHSFLKYWKKYRGVGNPREEMLRDVERC
ncbi:MAG: glycosyltransferase family 2 protein [bacterium]